MFSTTHPTRSIQTDTHCNTRRKSARRTRHRISQSSLAMALAILLGPVSLPRATAANPFTFTWIGSVSGNWSDAANWTICSAITCGNSVGNAYGYHGPLFSDSMVVLAGTQRLVTNYNNADPNLNERVFQGLSFAAGAGAFTVNGNNFGLGSGGIANKSSNVQTLNTDLQLFADQIWDGGSAGINVNGYLEMGASSLTLTNKVALHFANHDVGSYQSNAPQSLVIQSGSSVTSDGEFKVGPYVQSGTVTVTGAASSLTVKGSLNLGDVVNGNLGVYNGAKASADSLLLGRYGGRGTVEVSGAGSALAVDFNANRPSGNLIVTEGSLSFSQGGSLTNYYAEVGNYAGVTASLNVRDAGSRLDIFNLNLGKNGGTGQLNISNGGVANIYNLAVSKDSSITLDGGKLSVVNATNAGTLNWNAGTVNFTADTALGAGTLLGNDVSIKTGSTLQADGNLLVPTQSRLTLVGGLVQAKKLTIDALGSVSIDGASTLDVGSGGMDNRGSLTLSGGSLTGSGPLVNNGYLTGTGVIQSGSGAFTNRGVFAQTGALVLQTGIAENNQQWDVTGGQGILLKNTFLYNNYGTLSLDGGTISASDAAGGDSSGFANAPNATFIGHGRIAVPFSNAGRIVLDSGTLFLTGGFSNTGEILMTSNASVINGENGYFANDGRIQGQGKFRAIGIDNYGTVAAQGGTLTMDGFGNKTSGTVTVARDATLLASRGLPQNYGKIQLAGGTFDNNGLAMSNESTGVISGYGDLRAGVLTNKGRMLMSGGTSSVYADVVGASASKIILSGNSNTTFYGQAEFQSGSELRVSGGSVATFFETVRQRTGASFTGTGTKRFEGGLAVGNSPGLGTDEGDVEFGEGNTYLAEIGGATACSAACETDVTLRNRSFDKYIVGGSLSFGGTLKLTSWNGFVGQAGQHYDLFDWGTTTGSFASIDSTDFVTAQGTRLDLSSLYTTGEVAVVAVPVPEPGSWALMAAGLAGLGSLARRRRPSSQSDR